MKALCFGSLNIDYIYSVPHFAVKGETVAAEGRETYSGGKGMNQALALSRGGLETWLAGAIGDDGRFLLEELQQAGVHTECICLKHDVPTGHAMIQRDEHSDNCIIVYGGANLTISDASIDRTLNSFSKGDLLVIQNEINGLEHIIRGARGRGMRIAFNPSPMNESVMVLPLDLIDIFLMNEQEAAHMLHMPDTQGEQLAAALVDRYPSAAAVITMGIRGSVYADANGVIPQEAFITEPVDTTGAGDVFAGFFLSALCLGNDVKAALKTAAEASAISVTRKGAAPAVPQLA